jgi:hypothetical protein
VSCPHQITDPIGNTPCQVSFQTAGELKAPDILSKSNENIMYGIFCKIHIVREGNSQNQQTISVLFIDPAQGIPAPLFTFGHKQPVYHQKNLTDKQ